MSTESLFRLSGWSCVAGGTALIAQTLLHASLPEGCVGQDCLTQDMRGTAAGEGPFAVASAVLLAMAAMSLVVLARRRRPLGKVGIAALVSAAGALGFGGAAAVTGAVDDDFSWMPLLVLPALVLVVSTGILVAVLVLRARLIPTWLAVGVIASASLLLLANEQTALVLLAVPFETMCVVVGLTLITRDRQFLHNEQTQSAQLRGTQ
jgi:hypothetical protein